MILYIICGIIIAVILYSTIENRFLQLSVYHCRQTADSGTEKNPIRIIHLSDLHGCVYGRKNTRLIKKIIDTHPDIILLTGDMINRDSKVNENALFFFESIAAICPCYYSLGNHELRMKTYAPADYQRYIDCLKSFGICFLDNCSQSLTINDRAVEISGFSGELKGYKRSSKPDDYKPLYFPEPKNTGQSELRILLAHNPEFVSIYRNSPYQFILCGHLHGGIVRLPGIGGIISTRFRLFPKYTGGCYLIMDSEKKQKKTMIVSRGLGSHTIKFRLFNRPELILINME